MEFSLFGEGFTRAEMERKGGTWVQCLNEHEDGVIYLPLNEPLELLHLSNINEQGATL